MNELAAGFISRGPLSDELSVHQSVNCVRGRQSRTERTDLICRLVLQRSRLQWEAFRVAHKGVYRAQKTTFSPIIRAPFPSSRFSERLDIASHSRLLLSKGWSGEMSVPSIDTSRRDARAEREKDKIAGYRTINYEE